MEKKKKKGKGGRRCRSLSAGSPISETITILLSVVAEASGPGRWQERERRTWTPTRRLDRRSDEERETPCGPRGPGTPPSNIKCRINAVHNRPASTTAAAYVFSKPFLVLLHDGSLIVLPSRFRSRPLSFFERVFSAVLFRSSIAASFRSSSLFRSLFLVPRLSLLSTRSFSRTRLISLSYMSPLYSGCFPSVLLYEHSSTLSRAVTFISSYTLAIFLLESCFLLTFVLFLSVSRWFFHNLARLYFCTHSFSLLDWYVFSLLSLSRPMRMMFLSSEIYLSIEEIALGKGGGTASKEGKTLPPLEFRTVSIWEPPSILSRRHVEIFQIPRSDT